MHKAPTELKKRARKLNEKSVRQKAKYVLCWLQQNIRANANPVIDGAIATGNNLLPVVVYHGLGQGYPHASDRIHKFIIEASRSPAPEVEKRGLRCINYIERPAKFEKGLVYRLAKGAAAIVTNDVPAFVARRQAESVAAKAVVAVIAMDATCVVPMNEFPFPTDANAFFRRAQPPFREKYLTAKTEMAPDVSRYENGFDFKTDDLSGIDIEKLVAECDINRSVPPVERFNGSRPAASVKQQSFVKFFVQKTFGKTSVSNEFSSSFCSRSRLVTEIFGGYLGFECGGAFSESALILRSRWSSRSPLLFKLVGLRHYFDFCFCAKC